MSTALSAAVSGLKAHQTMLDVAGNNLANVNTAGYKSSSVTFAELLSQTIRGATGPMDNLGGTNPLQFGSGVEVSGIARNQSQGSIMSTGRDLDVAIDGSGFFVLSNGQQKVYTRAGSFATDANNTLIDPATGYKVLQLDNSSITIPWGTSMPASATTEIVMNGNLRSSAGSNQATVNKIVSNASFTINSGAGTATAATLLTDLDQWGVGGSAGYETGRLVLSGVKEDGTTFTNEEITWGAGATMQDILDGITALYDNSVAGLDANGRIMITALESGYNQAQVTGMSYVPGGTEALSLPTYFNYSSNGVGGNDTKTFTATVFDSMGQQHVLTGVFVKTNVPNTWDLVITSVSGETAASWSGYDILNDPSLNRRISGIEFNTDGSYKGLNSPLESTSFLVRYDNNPLPQQVSFYFGTEGGFSHLTQLDSPNSTASSLSQNGYSSGTLSAVTIDQNGTIIGTFTNGVKQDIAQLQIAVFSNPNGLTSAGSGYFIPTANSGEPVATTAGENGAGTLRGQSLEGSNVDMATEFVTLMQAQNGYQANARTIKVATDILRELTSLIR